MPDTSLPKLRVRLAVYVLFAFGTPAVCRVLDVRDLNVDEIRSLDRQRTAVILPRGVWEEHGPLDLGSDAAPTASDSGGYGNSRAAGERRPL